MLANITKPVILMLLGLGFLIALAACIDKNSRMLPEVQISSTTLTIFAGAASKPPLDEAIKTYEEKTGIRVFANYGGSGTMLSQIKLSRSGDLYIPASPDYLLKAEREGIIDPVSTRIMAYLVPVIAVQQGNPKNIQELSDLAKPGIKVGLSNPQAVSLGLYSIELLDFNHLLPDVTKNIVTYAENAEKTATLLSLKAVDAIIGWDIFQSWDTPNIEIIYLKPEQIPRIAYIPASISIFTKDKEATQNFLDFLVSPDVQRIFHKWGYFTSESEASKLTPNAKIGGEYQLPAVYNP